MADEIDEVTPDPFALRAHVLHPAITQNQIVGFDIEPTLFERFFQSPAFCAWSTGTTSWQLHCFGEPGCGKTTLAAVASSRLRRELNGVRTAVASITIGEHVASTSSDFVEDLFQCIHDSLGDEHSKEYTKYRLACEEGKPVVERIQKLSASLLNASPDTRKYIILDGYDRINEALQSVIDSQLSKLQKSGVKVMITRRVPVFSTPSNAQCDECEDDQLELWWECSTCNVFWLCYNCIKKEKLEKAHNCENAKFEETYSQVSVKLGDFPVEEFVAERVKLYHSHVGPELSERIVDYIKHKVGGNITLALLYLEDIFMRDDFSSLNTDRVDDRLPRDIIAFFDAEMSFIERRPEPQRLPPLLALAAAAHNDHGISLAKLEECIRLAQSASLNLDYPRGVEDVFKAANGWLTDPRTKDREVDICCKPAFTLYVMEDYNNSLSWAKRQLGFDAEHEAAAITSKQLVETPQLLGSTFDTLDSATSHPTPSGSIGDAQGLLGPNGMANSPLFVGEDEGYIQSPPRMDSVEDVKSPALPIQLRDLSLDGIIASHIPQEQSKRRVCDFCTSQILNSRTSSGQHQVSAHGARTSMDHCILCSALYSREHTSEISLDRQTWPLYHWALRTLPRGRELKGSLMLTFWPAHPTFTAKSFRFLPATDLHVPSPDQLPNSTNPNDSGGRQIREWMETCVRNHLGCNKNSDDKDPGTPFLPTRLIDVDTGDDNVVRLVETKVTKVKGPYCTLSHAWGPPEKKFLTTTVWNMAKHLLDGIKMRDLPPNFQQAIQITRFLKIRYIWIDSLVIVQEPYGDFAKEGDLMHKVYRYSYCNIVAADSSDGYGGLFRQRDPHAVLPVEVQGTGTIFGTRERTWTIVPADLWERELLSSFIYTRGWVFQERMLSPRILHFTKHQIFWDCGTLSACEVFPTGLPFPLDHKASTDRHWRGRLDQRQMSSNALSGANDNESSYTFWMSAVQNYTACNLTNQGDKTVAIWSVAKLLRDISSEQYAVGMWSNFLEEQLAWRVRDVDACERPPELQINIPSWSWASVKGPVVPQHRLALRSYKATNHDGGELSFTVEPITSPDTEPKLSTKMLALEGYVNVGRLVAVDGGHRVRLLNASVDIDAFPDEPLANTPIDPKHCEFVILAASSSNTKPSQSIPLNLAATPPPPAPTYSGIGILLIHRSTWFSHQDSQFRAFRSATHAGSSSSRETQWRSDAYAKLLLQRPKTTVEREEELIYRRVGAVHFRQLDKEVFKRLTRGRTRKIWIE